jgi:hypothetical protein
MKQVYLSGEKQYAFCAIDPFTRETAIRIASSPLSRNVKAALEKMVKRFGKGITAVNDNDSVAIHGM